MYHLLVLLPQDQDLDLTTVIENLRKTTSSELRGKAGYDIVVVSGKKRGQRLSPPRLFSLKLQRDYFAL